MRDVLTLVPGDFIGCGFSVAEWAQLDADERRAAVDARDALMQRQADMIVDTLMERVEEDAENEQLSAMMDAAEQEAKP